MNVSRIFELITPFTLVAIMGLIMIGNGIVHTGRENNELQYLFGVPLTLGALGAHFLVRRLLKQNTLYIWIAEAIVVASLGYQFYYVW